MAYIIAHGTVNGYQKLQSTLSDNRELQILTDIRTEFDNTSSMLTKSEGYLLQMSPSGVWVSIVKTMMDGERSGGGAGFFAFSAFVPKEQMIAGQQLKNILDKLMQHYLSLCPNFMTRNINVDWSFVTNTSTELNALCQPRRKTIDTHYTPSNNFAYVQATIEEQIIQLLDKPFQPEYGMYKAVFIGTHLQHPMRLPQQTCLNIDLENEVYDIYWSGDVNGWDKLPKTVRKKEIATGNVSFSKKYYLPITVKYSEGGKDDVNAILTLKVPVLQPEINKLTLQYDHPEAVVQVIASVQSREINDKSISNVLEFVGEEFASQVKIHLTLKDGYSCDDFILTPSECPNNTYQVRGIVKLKKIDLQILEYGENKTTKYKDSIRITKLGKSPSLSFNHAKSSLCLSIPENENFRDYTITLKNDAHHLLSDLKQNQEGFYTISVQQYKPKPSSSQKRSIYLDCKIIDKIEVFYNSQSCKINNNCIEIPITGTRDKISVKLGDRELKFKKVGNNRIKIYPPLFGCLSGGKTRLMLIGIVAILMLLVSVLLTLQFTNIIDIKKWFAREETVQVGGGGEEQTPPADSIIPQDTFTEEERLYNDLDSILKIQREKWHYETINNIRDHYDKTPVINPKHKANKLYKELVWMQCRKRLDGYLLDDRTGKWKPYENYKACSQKGTLINSWIFGIKKYGINSDNSSYATPELLKFLKEIVTAPDPKQKQFFEKYVKTKKVEKMTFSGVKHLWDNFIPSPEQPPKNPKGGSNMTPPQPAQQPILNPE